MCTRCTFSTDSIVSKCIVVVQLKLNGQMVIKASHIFNKALTSDTAYGCIEGINQEEYYVGVINGKRIIPTMKLNGIHNMLL